MVPKWVGLGLNWSSPFICALYYGLVAHYNFLSISHSVHCLPKHIPLSSLLEKMPLKKALSACCLLNSTHPNKDQIQSTVKERKRKKKKAYLLHKIHWKKRNPPPVLPILAPHISKPPILSRTPLPLLPPQIIVCEPDAPDPSQQNNNRRSQSVRYRHWMAAVEVN